MAYKALGGLVLPASRTFSVVTISPVHGASGPLDSIPWTQQTSASGPLRLLFLLLVILYPRSSHDWLLLTIQVSTKYHLLRADFHEHLGNFHELLTHSFMSINQESVWL